MSTAWRLVLRRADDAHRVRLEQVCDNDGIVQKCAMRREENDALTLLIFFNTKTYNRKLPLWQVLEAVSVPGVSMSGQPVERNDRAFDDFARTCRPEDVRRHGAEQGRYQRAAQPAVAAVASASTSVPAAPTKNDPIVCSGLQHHMHISPSWINDNASALSDFGAGSLILSPDGSFAVRTISAHVQLPNGELERREAVVRYEPCPSAGGENSEQRQNRARLNRAQEERAVYELDPAAGAAARRKHSDQQQEHAAVLAAQVERLERLLRRTCLLRRGAMEAEIIAATGRPWSERLFSKCDDWERRHRVSCLYIQHCLPAEPWPDRWPRDWWTQHDTCAKLLSINLTSTRAPELLGSLKVCVWELGTAR